LETNPAQYMPDIKSENLGGGRWHRPQPAMPEIQKTLSKNPVKPASC
jgi:hypothetical protein